MQAIPPGKLLKTVFMSLAAALDADEKKNYRSAFNKYTHCLYVISSHLKSMATPDNHALVGKLIHYSQECLRRLATIQQSHYGVVVGSNGPSRSPPRVTQSLRPPVTQQPAVPPTGSQAASLRPPYAGAAPTWQQGGFSTRRMERRQGLARNLGNIAMTHMNFTPAAGGSPPVGASQFAMTPPVITPSLGSGMIRRRGSVRGGAFASLRRIWEANEMEKMNQEQMIKHQERQVQALQQKRRLEVERFRRGVAKQKFRWRTQDEWTRFIDLELLYVKMPQAWLLRDKEFLEKYGNVGGRVKPEDKPGILAAHLAAIFEGASSGGIKASSLPLPGSSPTSRGEISKSIRGLLLGSDSGAVSGTVSSLGQGAVPPHCLKRIVDRFVFRLSEKYKGTVDPAAFQADISAFIQQLMCVLLGKFWRIPDSLAKESDAMETETLNFVTKQVNESLFPFLIHFFINRDADERKALNQSVNKKIQSFAQGGVNLMHLKVGEQFRLEEETAPYAKAIREFSRFCSETTIHQKLKGVEVSLQLISSTVDAYWASRKHSWSKDKLSVGAEDLLPIFAYVVMRCPVRDLFAHFRFVEQFLDEETCRGSSGYSLATLETVLNYIKKLTWDELKQGAVDQAKEEKEKAEARRKRKAAQAPVPKPETEAPVEFEAKPADVAEDKPAKTERTPSIERLSAEDLGAFLSGIGDVPSIEIPLSQAAQLAQAASGEAGESFTPLTPAPEDLPELSPDELDAFFADCEPAPEGSGEVAAAAPPPEKPPAGIQFPSVDDIPDIPSFDLPALPPSVPKLQPEQVVPPVSVSASPGDFADLDALLAGLKADLPTVAGQMPSPTQDPDPPAEQEQAPAIPDDLMEALAALSPPASVPVVAVDPEPTPDFSAMLKGLVPPGMKGEKITEQTRATFGEALSKDDGPTVVTAVVVPHPPEPVVPPAGAEIKKPAPASAPATDPGPVKKPAEFAVPDCGSVEFTEDDFAALEEIDGFDDLDDFT